MKLGWFAAVAVALLVSGTAAADANKQTKGKFDDKFRQLEVDLPTPNTYRTASGAPGESYWQQQADYTINASLDEIKKRITATGTITYRNNSPHALNYIWLQLDQNTFKEDSVSRRTARSVSPPMAAVSDSVSMASLRQLQAYKETPLGFEIQSVTDGGSRALRYTINDTMMRIDLPQPPLNSRPSPTTCRRTRPPRCRFPAMSIPPPRPM